MNTDIKESGLDQSAFSSVERKAPPATELLQQRILAETRQMPQESPLATATSKRQDQRRGFVWRLLPITGFATVMFSIAIGINSLLVSQSSLNEVSNAEALFTTSDELAWQDVMIMHDELAFIDL